MTTALKERIQDDIKEAMRAKDKEKLTALRLITAAIKQQEVDQRITLDDEQVLAILDKMLKQRKDSIEQFTNAGRDDLAKKEQLEIDIISNYLPEALSDDEVIELIAGAIKETGASGMQDMGKVMAILKPKVQGRADMGSVSQKVKQHLS